ncbi:MAG TPA: PQQ-binding-like beta-propeller repeat protein [Prolixibacteraceae bacterium]|nr:PQQ-binding-like beta-propeller repeat protein [Prolixibacteraceae bacterium]
MKKLIVLICLFGILSGSFQQYLQAQIAYNEQWPGFRGPWGCGFIENAKTATNWSLDNSENIKWKTPIPGLGHSCPVIWDDYLFVTTAANSKNSESLKVGLYGDIDEANDSTVHEFKVYCLDKNTGKIIWERVAHKGIPKSKRHTKASQTNCTPATNGKYLVVHFGSEGLYCYDLKGNLIWKKEMGLLAPGPYSDPGVEWGYASSPVIFKDKIIVQCDIPKTPYITVLDLATGNEIWKTSRGDEVSTWCTPAIYSKNGITQVIANGYTHMCGYEFETGKEIWKLRNGGDAPAPTPIIANDLIYLNSAHGKYSPIFAVRPNAKGDITLAPDSTKNQYIVWSIKRGGAYMQTPLIYQGYLYNLNVNGQLTCFDALTGEVKYKESLNEAFTASGIAADGKLYFSSEEGNIYVVKAGPAFQLLAKNDLRDICMATPAISGNTLFFRTQHALIAIE